MTAATAEKRHAEVALHRTHRQPYQGTSPIRIKKLGHIVYEVSNIERSVRFWSEVMGFQIIDRLPNGMIFMNSGPDHHGIGLRPVGDKQRPKKGSALDFEHLAFEVDNVEMLIKARDFLKANDIPIIFEGRKGPGCNISLNFLDPDGFEFEIYYGIDQIGESGGSRPASHYIRTDSLEEAIAKPVPKTW